MSHYFFDEYTRCYYVAYLKIDNFSPGLSSKLSSNNLIKLFLVSCFSVINKQITNDRKISTLIIILFDRRIITILIHLIFIVFPN